MDSDSNSIFLLKIIGHKSVLLGHSLLWTSILGFKTRVNSSLVCCSMIHLADLLTASIAVHPFLIHIRFQALLGLKLGISVGHCV